MRVLVVLSLAALLGAPTAAPAAPAAAAAPAAPAAVVTGRVTDALTGAPLAGRKVVADDDDVLGPGAPRTATTDADGRYRFTGSTARHYQVRVERLGADDPHLDTYAPGVLDVGRADWVLPPATADVAVQAGYRISGTWRNSGAAEDGEAVELDGLDTGVTSQVYAVHGSWLAWVPAGRYVASFVRADLGGQFWFGGAAAPVVDDVAHAAVLRVGPGLRSPDLQVTQPRDALVRIRVVDAVTRRPLTGACVLSDAGGRSEPGTAPPDGLHVVQDFCDAELAVRPGRDVVRVAQSCGHIPTLLTVHAQRGSTRAYTVALRRGGTVTGRAVDAATGKPLDVPLVEVLTRRPWPDVEHWDCDTPPRPAAGRFQQDTVPPGLLSVVVSDPGVSVAYPGRYAPGTDDAKHARVFRLLAGRTLDVGTVRLRRGGVLRGRVLDPAGRPVAGATVTGVSAGDGGTDRFATESFTTDALGRYRLVGVKAGSTLVRIEPPAWSPLPVQWLGGADEQHATKVPTRWGATVPAPDARLRAGGSLRVRVPGVVGSVAVEALDAAGRAVRYVVLVGPDGVATLDRLPAASLRVHVWSVDVQHPAETWFGGRHFADADGVVVRAGRTGTVTVPLRLPPAPQQAPAPGRSAAA
ncbi:MAG TPA: carboxypeptidase-like regulatory domain-containing protein [Kineosporiaceae bacterium]|nr:carboxypeptidase-like regulatory domain-containing protein [Kineosporiaceae bacterium]